MPEQTRTERRWRARPALAIAVRLLSFALPVAASVAAAWLTDRLLPQPTTTAGTVGTVLAILVVSTIVLLLTERVARRLLPLSALLRMTMAFPDTAPSRYKLARSAGRVRDIEERVRRAREQGLSDEPVEAAAELLTLVAALSRHDRGTRGHAERTRVFVDMLATEMDLEQHDRDRLRWAALLHDIGKLHVPATVLTKPDKPTDEEWAQLKRHPEDGMAIAAAMHDFLGPWADTIHHHHERYDGTGYPQALAGEAISLGGRIVAVADAFEVMTAARPYKTPMTAEEARAELTRCAGSHFDPHVVRAFLSISLGRLRWTIGPVSWLAQSPVLLQAGSRALDLGVAVGRGVAAVAVGGATIASGVAAALPAVAGPEIGADDAASDEPGAEPLADRAVPTSAPDDAVAAPDPPSPTDDATDPAPSADGSDGADVDASEDGDGTGDGTGGGTGGGTDDTDGGGTGGSGGGTGGPTDPPPTGGGDADDDPSGPVGDLVDATGVGDAGASTSTSAGVSTTGGSPTASVSTSVTVDGPVSGTVDVPTTTVTVPVPDLPISTPTVEPEVELDVDLGGLLGDR